MPVDAISPASGADLLAALAQSTGQSNQPPPASATIAALKLALDEAKINLAALIGDGATSVAPETGNQINVLA